MSTATLPRLLTATELSHATGMPVATVWELSRRGELPKVRIGTRSYRYPLDAVLQWIENGGAGDEGRAA